MALFPHTFDHSKVQAWLGDPDTYCGGPQLSIESSPTRKRRRRPGRVSSPSKTSPAPDPTGLQCPSSPTQPRRPLRATTRNNMASRDGNGDDTDPIKRPAKPPTRRTTPMAVPSRSQQPRRQSPRKGLSGVTPNAASNRDRPETSGLSVSGDNAGDLTRGRPSADFSPPSNPPTLWSGAGAFLPQSLTQSRSTNQTRSTSPSKSMHDLAMADPPIRFYETLSIHPPENVAMLYQRICDSCEGFKLLPYSLKDEIKLHSGSAYKRLKDFHFQDQPRTQSEPDPASPSASDAMQEDIQVWKGVKNIAAMALKCSQDDAAEAAWGERVYSRIFSLALETFYLHNSVGWENITTARIEPRTLTPRHLTGKMFSSKMVDYAFVLLPDDTMYRSILDILRQAPYDEDQNINQTRAGSVRFRPITVNVEVKVPGEGRNQTMVQLSVWVTAQFKKLNALTGGLGAVQDICIPLISVEGHDWRVYIAYQTADGEVIIWGNQVFGDTASVLGIYRVIAGLRTLAEWSHVEYRAWFEKEVLQIDC